MRYDGQRGKILIGLSELVSCARRRISPTLPFEEDEPAVKADAYEVGEPIEYCFEAGGYEFCLSARVDARGSELYLTRDIDTSPSRPSRAALAELRGEAFVLAKAYAELHSLPELTLIITLVNRKTAEEAERRESVSRAALDKFFERCRVSVGIYARPEAERVTRRLPSLARLKFPYRNMRDGQGEFIRAAYRNIARGTTLIATAPTGTGKTVSALFPALRALGDGHIDKVFYLTPKTTTAEAARECLTTIGEGAELRAVMLRAKERTCRRGLLCRDTRDACENSKCNKLAEAVIELYDMQKTVIDGIDIALVAERYRTCPYELSLAYSEIADVVICDVNYLFDPVVYLRRFFTEGGRYAFLVDEAHNLPERAREIYSAEISTSEIISLAENPLITEHSPLIMRLYKSAEAIDRIISPHLSDGMRTSPEGRRSSFAHLSEPPPELYEIFSSLTEALDAELLSILISPDAEKYARARAVRELLYKVKRFEATLLAFDDAYKMFLYFDEGDIKIKLLCIDTGKEIARRVELGHGAVFFSATLSPADYYKSTLGADSSAELLVLPSPFAPEQLSVAIMDKISTRYSERERTLGAVSRVIAATLSAKRGNYMVFCPSFEYAEALAADFSRKYPKLGVLLQRRGMSGKEREDFLDAFRSHSPQYLIGFCVMGGIYSEGVDLVGDSLIGAIVVGIGMPALSNEREAISEYYNERYDEGRLFAYVYPGMNRVLQAAGRVIRREDDRGVIVLIDDRFDDPVYKKIIPDLWRGMNFVDDAKDLKLILEDFWRQ
ncbi:MAG: ATP-dependent DNA helicase [Clostridia bacterium]|nr:ATP-dependent DNA helicase [Clostridia bacterium]